MRAKQKPSYKELVKAIDKATTLLKCQNQLIKNMIDDAESGYQKTQKHLYRYEELRNEVSRLNIKISNFS